MDGCSPQSAVHDLEQTRVHVLVRARRGDFAEFVRIYVPLVYKLARGRALDENAVLDVAQDALLDLVRKMQRLRYDPKKQFRHFVRRVVHRRKIDYLRRQREESLESVARGRGLACDEVEELSDGSSGQRSSDDRLDSERRQSVLDAAFDEVRREVHPSTYRRSSSSCCRARASKKPRAPSARRTTRSRRTSIAPC
jgi:RNA polymerase sigma-70 factor (ECF subfamily)